KPDVRFGLEIQDATEVTRTSEFGVFADADCVRLLVVPTAFSRAQLQRLEEFAKGWGAKGLAYVIVGESGELGSPIAKFLSAQERVFRAMGMTDEEAEAKFGWFLEALQMGAPPHGGFALGIERFVALLAGEANIREIIAFPKTASGSDPLTGAPAPTTQERLSELGIRLQVPPDSTRD